MAGRAAFAEEARRDFVCSGWRRCSSELFQRSGGDIPGKHPVNHELLRYGDLAQVSERLDREMGGKVEALGPFRFTASFLVYDSGHEFQMVPYDQIASAEIDKPGSDEPAAIVVQTRRGRRYQWYRTWMQGRFNPERVLEKIRAAAHLDAPAG